MVVRRPLLERLSNEGHYFNASQPSKRLTPAGPDHAQIAATQGIAEYFDALDRHHGGDNPARSPQRVRDLLRAAEAPLLTELLSYLKGRKGLRVLGPTDSTQRAATVSFLPDAIDPAEVIRELAERGFMAGNGNFYAVRLLEAMGVDATRGAVRVSFVHYNSMQEITHLIQALDSILP
jgi:selenocysteine lyase/cysteine desulfurase